MFINKENEKRKSTATILSKCKNEVLTNLSTNKLKAKLKLINKLQYLLGNFVICHLGHEVFLAADKF